MFAIRQPFWAGISLQRDLIALIVTYVANMIGVKHFRVLVKSKKLA